MVFENTEITQKVHLGVRCFHRMVNDLQQRYHKKIALSLNKFESFHFMKSGKMTELSDGPRVVWI